MVIAVVACRVSVADQVEPVHRHALAEMLRSKQPIYQPFVCVRRPVDDECICNFGPGRKPDQVKGQPAQQRPPVGLWRGFKSLLLQPGQDKAIDSAGRPGRVAHGRQFRPSRRNQGPVLLPFSALFNP